MGIFESRSKEFYFPGPLCWRQWKQEDVGVAGDMDSCNECRKFLKKRGYIPSKGCGGGCGSGNVNVDVGVCFL